MKRLIHSKVNGMRPVKGWAEKVEGLNRWIDANYNKMLDCGISCEIIHTVYIQVHNRLKYTSWAIIDGSYNNLLYSACYIQSRKQAYIEGRYIGLNFDLPEKQEQPINQKRVNRSKVKRCVNQLSDLQRVVFKETVGKNRSIKEAALKINLEYNKAANAHYASISRVAQLYNTSTL